MTMKIRLTSTIYILIGFASNLFSQTSSSSTFEIEEVVISAGPTKINVEESPRSISVIKAQEIIQSEAVSVGEILETLPGIDYRQRGPIGIQADLSIRGGSFEQNALILNGVRVSAPQTGHHLMDLTFDPEDIKRIEVVRGGTAPYIGMGAFSGAINILTGPGDSDSFLGTIEAGGNGYSRIKARLDFGKEKYRQRIALSNAKTNGHIENTDATMMIGSYSSYLETDFGLFKFELSFADKKFGAQNFYTSTYPTQYEETQTYRGQLSWERSTKNIDLFVAMHTRIHDDMFELYRVHEDYYQSTIDSISNNEILIMGNDTAPSWYNSPNYHKSLTSGLVANALYKNKLGYTSLRIDARNESVYSNLLGTQEWAEDGLFQNDSILTNGDGRFNTELALSHTFQKNKFSLSMTSGMFNSTYGTYLLPAVNTTFKVGENQMLSYLFASANRSVRLPSYTDLYYKIGGAQGSQDLLPELSNNYEIGYRWIYNLKSGRKITFENSLFRRDGENLIDWVKFDGEEITRATNLREVTFDGIESSLTFSNTKTLGNVGNSLQVSYSAINASETSSGFQSNYVLDFLRRKFDIKALIVLPDFKISQSDTRFDFSVRYSIQERINSSRVGILSSTLSGYFNGEKMRAFIRVDNALDAEIIDIGSIQLPGRWVRAGITITIDN